MTERQEIRVKALECTTRFLQYMGGRTKYDFESGSPETRGMAIDIVEFIATRFEEFILKAPDDLTKQSDKI
jgi:hypothetical protein